MAIVGPNGRDAQPPLIGSGPGGQTANLSCGLPGAWATCPFKVGAQAAHNRTPATHRDVPERLDETILALFRRGMTVREIGTYLRRQCRVELGDAAIRAVADSAIEPLEEWQARHLDRMYPIVFFHALPVKVREDGMVKHKSAHVAFAVSCDGKRDELGIWIGEDEPFWQRVMGDIKARGVEDILIVAMDGLNAFPEAIASTFPRAHVQTCFLHLFRSSLSYCVFSERVVVDRELKNIFRAESADGALQMLGEFERSALGQKFPMIAASWKRYWSAVAPLFDWPQEIRTLFYLTKTIEDPRVQLLKAIQILGVFPDDEAVAQQIHLALRGIIKMKKKAPVKWKATSLQFAVRFGKRFTGGPDDSHG